MAERGHHDAASPNAGAGGVSGLSHRTLCPGDGDSTPEVPKRPFSAARDKRGRAEAAILWFSVWQCAFCPPVAPVALRSIPQPGASAAAELPPHPNQSSSSGATGWAGEPHSAATEVRRGNRQGNMDDEVAVTVHHADRDNGW